MKSLLAVALFFAVPSFGQYSNVTLNFNDVGSYLTDGGVLFQQVLQSVAGYEY